MLTLEHELLYRWGIVGMYTIIQQDKKSEYEIMEEIISDTERALTSEY